MIDSCIWNLLLHGSDVRTVLRKHAKEFGGASFIFLMMTQIMQESGGQRSDPI